MIKLKKIKFINYCGYRDVEFDLSDISVDDPNGIKKWFVLFSPNGYGKSNLLNGVRLLGYPWEIEGLTELSSDPNDLKNNRNALMFRRLTYSPDYQPGYEAWAIKNNLYMEAIFQTEDGDKKVIIENNFDKNFSGVSLNELPKNINSVVFALDADNPMNLYKFQIKEECAQEFLDFATGVYDFPCELPEGCKVPVTIDGKTVYFYTDFILHKLNAKVHYKRFSGGEKKIATLLATLFNTIYKNNTCSNNILLIDNIEKEVYFERHMKLIAKMNEFFPKEQILATTHSPVIINEMDKKYLCDLRDYIKN
jgi:hypothetical protein